MLSFTKYTERCAGGTPRTLVLHADGLYFQNSGQFRFSLGFEDPMVWVHQRPTEHHSWGSANSLKSKESILSERILKMPLSVWRLMPLGHKEGKTPLTLTTPIRMFQSLLREWLIYRMGSLFPGDLLKCFYPALRHQNTNPHRHTF